MTQKATVMEPYVNKVYNFIILRKLKPKLFEILKKTLFIRNISTTAHYPTSTHIFFQNQKNSLVNITNVMKNQSQKEKSRNPLQ